MAQGLAQVMPFLLIIAVIAFFVVRRNRNIQSKANEYNAVASIQVMHKLGVPGLNSGSLTTLYLGEKKLRIESGDTNFELPVDRLRAAAAKTHTELLQKQKSIAGRAVVGGLLLGPVGAIVGGMTGIGKKEQKGNYLVLNYVTRDGDVDAMVFWCGSLSVAEKFAKTASASILTQNTVDGVVQL